MWISTAFLFGFLGSFHCATMCGPIAMALPVNDKGKIFSKIYYNFGRIITYSILGALIGLFGRSMALTGFQKTLSIASGVLIVLVALFPLVIEKRIAVNQKLFKLSTFVKSVFKKFIHRKNNSSYLIVGLANGILPCGFVYLAMSASLAMGSIEGSAGYMALFGLGTVPMMLTLGLGGNFVQAKFRSQVNRIVPVIAAVMGVWLIIRGINYQPHSCCHH
jgi:hypothetical protein